MTTGTWSPYCYSSTNRTFSWQSNGGLLLTFGINAILFLILFLLFLLLRQLAWNYGFMGFLQKTNSWLPAFCPVRRTCTSMGHASQESTESGNSCFGNQGYFCSILRIFSGNDLAKRVGGIDAHNYLCFQEYLLLYLVAICPLSILILLPLNMSGDRNLEGVQSTTIFNLDSHSPDQWAHAVLAVVYHIILVVVMVVYELRMAIGRSQMSNLTAKVNYVPIGVQSKICEHIVEVYSSQVEIVDCRYGYDIRRLYKLHRQRQCILEALTYLRSFPEGRSLTRLQLQRCTSYLLTPWCSSTEISYEKILARFDTLLEATTERIHEECSNLITQPKPVVFITFAKSHMMRRFVRDYDGLHIATRPPSSLSDQLKTKMWLASPAPYAVDLVWENLMNMPVVWWIRILVINFLMITGLMFLTAPSVLIPTIYRSNMPPNVTSTASTNQQTVESQLIPTLLVYTLSRFLPWVVIFLTKCEGHLSRSSREKTMLFKVFVFELFMTVILPLVSLLGYWDIAASFTHTRSQTKEEVICVLGNVNWVYFMSYVITASLFGQGLELLRVFDLAQHSIRMFSASHVGERIYLTKEPKEMHYGVGYANTLAVFSVVVMYSTTCPLIVLLGIMYMLMKIFVDRHNIQFIYRPQQLASIGSIHKTASRIAMTCPLLVQLAQIFSPLSNSLRMTSPIMFSIALFVTSVGMFLIFLGYRTYRNYYHYKTYSVEGEVGERDIFKSEEYLPPILVSYLSQLNPWRDHPSASMTSAAVEAREHPVRLMDNLTVRYSAEER